MCNRKATVTSSVKPSRSREVPLGRSALWLCVGYGIGASLGGALAMGVGLRAIDYSTGLAVVWPLVIGMMAAVLLIVGTMPMQRITINAAAAKVIEQHGVAGVARVRHVAMTSAGTVKTVSVSLDARSAKGRSIRSELVWKLPAVDALKLHPKAVIPVRIDPVSPSRMVFDSEASLHDWSGLDPNEVFSVRNRFMERLSTFRPASAVALVVGVGAGVALGLWS